MSRGDFQSSRPGLSVEDGAVDAALNREELSVVKDVLFDAPLPLHRVSIRRSNVDRANKSRRTGASMSGYISLSSPRVCQIAYRLFPMFSNMFSVSSCEVLVLPGDPALASFTPPSKDLLPVSARSKTLNDCSAKGVSTPSSSTFADDFRRAKALGNLGMKYVWLSKTVLNLTSTLQIETTAR